MKPKRQSFFNTVNPHDDASSTWGEFFWRELSKVAFASQSRACNAETPFGESVKEQSGFLFSGGARAEFK